MLELITGKLQILFGDDLNDVERYIAATPRRWQGASSTSVPNTLPWDLNAGWDGALRMAREGWSEGAKEMDDALRALPSPTTHHAEYRYDVAGHFPDVARYVSGDPAHMVTRGKRMGSPPTVHLVIATNASSRVTAGEMRNYGLAIAAMVDKIESGDRRVEIDVVFPSTMAGDYRSTPGWKVKRAQDHMDLSAIAFSIGHPAAFRRLGFALYERCARECEHSAYGRSVDITKEELRLIGAEDAIVIPGVKHAPGECVTPEKALAFAAKQINDLAGYDLVEIAA